MDRIKTKVYCTDCYCSVYSWLEFILKCKHFNKMKPPEYDKKHTIKDRYPCCFIANGTGTCEFFTKKEPTWLEKIIRRLP